MATKYNLCIAAGKYNEVSPGEVCTIDQAKNKLGIYDAANYFKASAGYGDVRVYNAARDDPSNQPYDLCIQSASGNDAYANCALEHGVGFTRKAGSPGVCATASCPTGFEAEPRGVCRKPLNDFVLSKRARCDERWYDWFMVPNYHLGNNYKAGDKPGECLAPCPAGNVPTYATDPVDGANVDFTSKTDLTKCVSREDYFGGKYAKGSEYCPVAWVTRMAATPKYFSDNARAGLQQVIDATGGEANEHAAAVREGLEEKTKDLAKKAAGVLELVEPLTQTQAAACAKMNTEDRLREAYAVCEQVRDDETRFARKLEEEMGDDEAAQNQKIAVIKTACTALFCDESNDPYVAERIGKEPVCFKKPKIELDATGEPKVGPAPNADEGKAFVRKSVVVAMVILFGMMGLVAAIFATTRFIWPQVLRPLWRLLVRLLTGWRTSAEADAIKASIEDVMAPVPKK